MTDQFDAGVDEQPDTEALVEAARSLIGIEPVWSGQLLYTCVQLGVIDRLRDEPVSAETVAVELDLEPEYTYRVLRALSHFGVLAEDDERRFTLTALGALFTAEHPSSVRHALLVDRSPEWMRPMLQLEDVLREGEPDGFERAFGQGFFEYLQGNPEFAAVFNDHMTARSKRETDVVLAAIPESRFADCRHVCDVGGGHGHLLCSLLAEQEHLEGTVLELASTIAETDRLWAPTLGVADRCTYAAGDMFEAVPTADAYLMKVILHDWRDAECVEILETIAEAAPPDARLFVVEAVVPGPDEPHFAKRLDMTMLVHVGGRERTEPEYRELLSTGGWRHVETHVPDEGPLSVLEARPA